MIVAVYVDDIIIATVYVDDIIIATEWEEKMNHSDSGESGIVIEVAVHMDVTIQ